MNWKDITSYSRGDKERIPKTFEIRSGIMRICVTKGHIYYPKEWVMHCSKVDFDSVVLCSSDTSVEEAQKIAIEKVRSRLNHLSMCLNSIENELD